MSEREESYSTFSESGGFQAMTVTEFCMSPKQTPKAMLTLAYGTILWNNRKSWSFKKKTQNKRRHNEKGFMCLCLSCQDINSDTMYLLMRKITACFHAMNTETVSMVWTCRFARKWTGLCISPGWTFPFRCTQRRARLCMGVLLNGHLPWVFLALIKEHLCSSLQPSQPFYFLAGISLELHLVAAWPQS